MRREPHLTQSKIKELFSYENGNFTWKVRTSSKTKVGSIAGYVNHDGYRQIRVNGVSYQAHRLVWLYFHGDFPFHQLDHINGIKLDNRIENLREATNAQNARNTPKCKTNTSGFKGVTFHKKTKKWQAQAKINGVNNYLGLFSTPEEASDMYESFAKENHGEFYRSSTA